uniref:Secreted protein n=1 Tax=Bursaphelenchus xylophilus TaxID=6326 RepID=A0A1I7RIK9_BURXY
MLLFQIIVYHYVHPIMCVGGNFAISVITVYTILDATALRFDYGLSNCPEWCRRDNYVSRTDGDELWFHAVILLSVEPQWKDTIVVAYHTFYATSINHSSNHYGLCTNHTMENRKITIYVAESHLQRVVAATSSPITSVPTLPGFATLNSCSQRSEAETKL